ncbi:MAG TPA: ADP-ribosylglycohydrolase family protein [Brevefilum fermentans]|jgi:ADP-ribosylglycohydrolase|uniref:Putative enzyme n=1 Tax=Candidatus Brevifilum fermentans TaxID=1986204 RepID=A0A1Y6K1D2_9CHLR|nr:ADP-ribosylglycohydrolase family protein [Brevefilum fermentans]MDI9565454.1 ADP-ribosylglycohydrolase family protein [Chloroflexota bacterium]OQB83132.1 MAG: ADP-ribosylglycohydrolase [Chloroflexi bacterium ADurb.Bin120]SMX53463.1 putative enzyme [Brevefilum fermentans]HOM67265.1 ADP-ribosylglycohydrolase family protein [Brevefilum fermentans]HQA28459.1 ADP-ribosylglycohydrolase family protein [Brevefilum fermentans]
MRHIYDTLVGLAYGDSLGMPVEMWPRKRVFEAVGKVDRLLPGQTGNLITSSLKKGAVTDDTHISLILCQQLIEEGDIIPEHFLSRLMNWVENNPESAELIGPSTIKAVELFQQGMALEQIGLFGETNGGAMRIAPIGIFFDLREFDTFMAKVHLACLPTHNTAIAISGAAAIAAAVSYGVHVGSDLNEMLTWVRKAATAGRDFGRDLGYPHIDKRLDLIISLFNQHKDVEARQELLHKSLGTSIQTIDSVPTSLATALFYQGQLRESLQFTANLGGDTDTISAMTGAICGALNGAHQIPAEDIELIERVNSIDFSGIADRICQKLDSMPRLS